MPNLKYLYTFFILAFIGLISYLIYWTYKLPQPTPGTGCASSKTLGWKWNDKCTYIQELEPDTTLQSPKSISPYLVKFQLSQGAGPSIFVGCWYRFRYVNVLTGGYSDFSDWTKGAVYSGNCKLPCDPAQNGSCPFPQGLASCTFNQPTIGVNKKDSQYSPQTQDPSAKTFVYLNLHRYVNTNDPFSSIPPNDNVQDEIVGTLLSSVTSNGQSYWSLIDVLQNPCKNGCNAPGVCSGGAKC